MRGCSSQRDHGGRGPAAPDARIRLALFPAGLPLSEEVWRRAAAKRGPEERVHRAGPFWCVALMVRPARGVAAMGPMVPTLAGPGSTASVMALAL